MTPEHIEKMTLGRQKAREAKIAEKLAAKAAAGIPDSKPFGGDPSADDNPILNCHVGGVLVRSLPVEMQGRILWQQTDEGIAANNEGKSEHRITTTRDEFTKALDQRRDDVKDRGFETYEARDPLKEVYDQHIAPGQRGKFLSAKRMKENGGTGDWKPVIGDNGDPVTVRGMVLGQMPETKAIARNKHYRERSSRLISEMTQKYKQEGGATAVADQD